MNPGHPGYRHWRVRIFAITWLAYAGFYLTRKSFAVAKVELAKPEVMGMAKADMAWIDLGYLCAYALGQFVWGMSGDRFGTRRVILAGMMVSIVAAVAMGASTLTIALGVFFLVQGLAQSTGWAPLTKNMSYFFAHHERGAVMGFWCTNYAIGGLVGAAYAGWAAEKYGWRYAFWVPAATLLVIWLGFLVLQRNRPRDAGMPEFDAPASSESGRGEAQARVDAWSVIRQPTVLRLGAVYFFLKPTRYLILFWSPVYVNEILGTGATESGVLGAMFELAGPIAIVLGGIASDRMFNSRRMPVAVWCLSALAIALLLFPHVPATKLAVGGGLFVIGFLLFAPDSLVSATAAIDFGKRRGASTAAGFINGCGSVGAIIGGTLPGWVDRLELEDPWVAIFVALAVSTAAASLLLLSRYNALPPSEQEPATRTP